MKGAKLPISDSIAETAAIDIMRAKAESAKYKRMYKDAISHSANLEVQMEALLGIKDDPIILDWKKARKGNPKNVAVIVPATDWHVEEGIEAGSVNGKNFFNLAEAENRIKRFYTKIIRLTEWQSHLARVSEVWHPLLGDLLTGYIHEELMESNSLSPTEACIFLQEMLCSGIDLLLRETKLPIYIPTCVGNHGRTTQKMHIKTSSSNSYEWLLYMTLAKQYAKNKRVHIFVGKGYHNTQTIMGRKVRFHHGDGFRYQGGVGGITIPVAKAISQWNKVETVDLDIFGHYHTHLVNYTTWVSCGSLMGYSEYSVKIKADFQHPTQTFIVLDKDFGLTCAIPVFLTKSWKETHGEV